jgi:hypothetical protein
MPVTACAAPMPVMNPGPHQTCLSLASSQDTEIPNALLRPRFIIHPAARRCGVLNWRVVRISLSALIMPVPSAWSAAQIEGYNPLRKAAILTLLVFVFLALSRILDDHPWIARLHIPLILVLLTVASAVVSGSLASVLGTRVAKICLSMTAWMILGIPFAIYRRGAFDAVVGWLQYPMLSLVLVIGLIVTYKDAAGLMNAIALSSLAVSLIALRTGTATLGRLAVNNGGNLANPNDLAFAILIGIPLWLRLMRHGGVARKCMALAALAPMLVCFFKTGSRGGLVAFCVMIIAAFLRSSPSGKIKIAFAGAMVLTIGLAAIPADLRHRYVIDLADSDAGRNDDQSRAAEGSSEQRRILLVESLKMAATHPLFGVGGTNFADAENQIARSEGRPKGNWLGTHNTYTQLAAECGIPALILFISMLVSSIRSVSAVRRRLIADPRPMADQIREAAAASETVLWGMAAFIFFAHRAYDLNIYLLFGVAVVVARAADLELPALPAVPIAPAQPMRRRAVARVR